MSRRALPELPEVETIARELHARLQGRTITAVDVIRSDVLRQTSAEHLRLYCTGARIERAWRRGKSAIISLANRWHLLIQPRFTGAILVDDPVNRAPERSAELDGSIESIVDGERGAVRPADYAVVEWQLSDGGRFWYRDVRRLGTIQFVDDAGLRAYEARIGAEPLDPAFSADRLSVLLRVSRSAIKKVLMDQRILAGIGNIYANEALSRSGIDPSREARSLSLVEVDLLFDALTTTLRASIQARGTTFRDYRDPSNRSGSFAAQLVAYGRGGEPCARCACRLVETHAIDGRSTVFCYRCQR